MQEQSNGSKKEKIPWYAYVVLLLTIIIFAGFFGKSTTPLKALDFNNLLGNFGALGQVEEGAKVTLANDFKGIGGSGAREGILLVLSISPAIIVAFGIIEICTQYKGILAAQVLFSPIMKVLMGVPGAAAISVVTSLTSSDAGAGLVKSLADENYLNDRQRIILTSFELLAPSILVNFFAMGVTVSDYITRPISIALLVIIIMKVVGANIARILVKIMYKEDQIS